MEVELHTAPNRYSPSRFSPSAVEPHPIGPQGTEVLHALQDIGEMAQGVFGGLGAAVRGAGKGPEGGHIHKAPLVPPADVQVPGPGGERWQRRPLRV